jgi:SAM-dependent methyltransferase
MWWEPFKAGTSEFYESLHVLRDMYRFADELQFDHRTFLSNPPLPGGDLLDVGCGTGVFLSRARRHGFRVTGIDIDQRAIETAKKRHGIGDAHPMSLEEFSQRFPGRKFDVITCFQILEHLDNIRGFLSLVRTLLKPGGFIVIGTPNRERWVEPRQMPFHKTANIGDYPPMHLTRWNKKALENLLRSERFAHIKVLVSPFSFGEARDYITRQVSLVYVAQAWLVSVVKKSRTTSERAQGSGKTQVLSNIMELARRLRKGLLFAPSLPVFLYGRAFYKQGCILYATGKCVP